jgi:hypothetical protein
MDEINDPNLAAKATPDLSNSTLERAESPAPQTPALDIDSWEDGR